MSTGSKDIAGTVWDTWENGDRRSLVRAVGADETIVSGTAPWEELAILAASLQPVAASTS